MKEATNKDISALLDFLRNDVGNALYLYMDIGKYGLDNPNIRVWFEEKGTGINCVVMKYFSSFQLYAASSPACIRDIQALIKAYQPEMVSGPAFLIRSIQKELHGEFTYGTVFQIREYREFEPVCPIEQATVSDTSEIAALICTAPSFGKHYQAEALAGQLAERISTGMGRSFIIRKDGKMIAHISTFAEYGQLAITSGLVVHPTHQGTASYGTILESYLFNLLLREGKQVYTQVLHPNRVRALRCLGGTIIGQYGKIQHLQL